MPSEFETGTPTTGLELGLGLGRLIASGTAYLSTIPDRQFFAPQGGAWSPADHVRHLTMSSAPLVLALKLPRWALALRFGRGTGRSRTFTEMRTAYRQRLTEGGQAGRFAPSPRPVPADTGAGRLGIMKGWTRTTVELQNAIRRWSEPALDGQLLPHPLLGPLTVREMLAFTVYHTAHHLQRVAERAGSSPT
jgi:DinB superfamily